MKIRNFLESNEKLSDAPKQSLLSNPAGSGEHAAAMLPLYLQYNSQQPPSPPLTIPLQPVISSPAGTPLRGVVA